MLQNRALVNEYRHPEGGIVRLFPNTLGTRLLFVDSQTAVHLYNPVNDQVPHWPCCSHVRAPAVWLVRDTSDATEEMRF
jgi:WD repeat-containing protein 19